MAMSRLRDMPAVLPGATKFSTDQVLDDPLWIARTLKSLPQFSSDLLADTNLTKNGGRPRQHGSWALAYLVFAGSRHAHLRPWWGQTQDSLWRECGFAARPTFQTVWLRFAELEDHSSRFESGAQKLIRHARRHEPRIGNDLHIDGTEAETNARLIHDCQAGDACKRGAATLISRPTTDVRAERHLLSEQKPAGEGQDFGVGQNYQPGPAGARIKIGGCWYKTRDKSAGIRAYGGPRGLKKFWHGFYNHKAIDHFTGAPLAVSVVSASVQEHNSYEEILDKAVEAIGDKPRAVVADRGFSIGHVFEHNTRQGIASVIPWRKTPQEKKRTDHEEFDRHGIPRCRHCGGEGIFHRFESGSRLRISFRCAAPQTQGCSKIQSISPTADWRLLIPLWRTEAAYLALRDSHSEYERVHQHWRDRYCVGADDHGTRPRRPGAAWQQLRASAALLIEWTRICSREGWLGSARRNRRAPRARSGATASNRLRDIRHKIGLDLPYGRIAASLGIGSADPPSLRRKRT